MQKGWQFGCAEGAKEQEGRFEKDGIVLLQDWWILKGLESGCRCRKSPKHKKDCWKRRTSTWWVKDMFSEGKLSDRISSNLAVVIILYLTFEMCSSEYLAASINICEKAGILSRSEYSLPFLLMVYLSLYLCICAKKWECATRLSSSGLPSLGDPCRPRWERGPCRSRGAGGAGSAAQPTKQVAPEGRRGGRGIFGLTNFWSQGLSLEDVTAGDLNRVGRQLLCSHRSHQVGRGTQVARYILILFF